MLGSMVEVSVREVAVWTSETMTECGFRCDQMTFPEVAAETVMAHRDRVS
jgi:hypothetical protein